MIQLIINNEPVDLNENSSISITEESPVFEKDSIPGGFSFPFELPASPRNNRILSHPGRIQSAFQGGFNLPFQLYLDGRLIGTGTATIQKATSLSYSAFLQVGTGDFAGKTEGKKLSDVDFGGSRTWGFKPEFTYPEDDFALFPVYNPNFMDDTQYKDEWLSNGNRLNAYGNGAYYNEPNSIMAVTPFPFLAYVVERLFNQFGFVVKQNILTSDPDLKKLVIYSNHDSATLSRVRTSERRWEVDMLTGSYHYRTYWNITITRSLDTWNLVDFLPDILIKDFILTIRTAFNLAITIDNQGYVSIARRKDLVSSGKAIPLTGKAFGRPLVTITENKTAYRFHFEHDQKDLLFSDGFKDIHESPQLVKDPVQFYDNLIDIDATLNEIRLVTTTGYYYQYASLVVDGETRYSWNLFSNDFQDLIVGNDPIEYSALASTLPMFNYQRTPGGPFIRCPQAAQLSNSTLRPEPVPCSLRFLLYHGMIANSTGQLYPYGSSDSLDPNGELLENSKLSLKWQGDTGLYNQLWKPYLNWWNTRKVVTWSIADPAALDFFTVYEIDKNQYLLKTRSVLLLNEGVQPGECEFYLV